MVYMEQLEKIRAEIKQDPANQHFSQAGIEPLFQVFEQAEVLVIGQAPGLKTQERGQCFRDQSGDRLREWLGIDEEIFYDSGKLAVLPMDFYYPGRGPSGDLPPRSFVSKNWHPLLLDLMSHVKLTLLIGQYAQHYYLSDGLNLTQRVKSYQTYLPAYFPLPHPSPRNNIWLRKNPWFESDVLPALKEQIGEIL